MDNGSSLEWVMFALAGVGFLFTTYIRTLAVRDANRARKDNWSYAAQLIAEGNVAGETLNVVLSGICLLSGIVAVSVQPPPGELLIQAQWKLVSLIIISFLISAQSVRALWYRRRILGLLSIREGPKEETAIHDFGRTAGSVN